MIDFVFALLDLCQHAMDTGKKTGPELSTDHHMVLSWTDDGGECWVCEDNHEEELVWEIFSSCLWGGWGH